MARLHLIIANKNYSSWSLRPWLAMTMAGLLFEETIIPLDTPSTKKQIAEHSKAGRLPILRHGKVTIWETLAILEYLAETFPEKNFGLKPKRQEPWRVPFPMKCMPGFQICAMPAQ